MVVVTHLAQVAAWADTQLVVVKETPGAVAAGGPGPDDPGTAGGTRTRVVRVAGSERVVELARMLSGHERSEAALRHAAELLEEASAQASVAQSPT